MWKIFNVIALEMALLELVTSCAGGIGGNGILTNPSISMKFHPPTGWTYPETTAATDISYFPGQPLTQTEAQLRANGDIESAVLAGLQTLQISTLGVTVTPQYSPPLVSDCKKSTATPTTTSQFGYEEGGAITKLITPPAAGATQVQCSTHSFPSTTGSVFTMVDFIQQASVKIDGITMSEYQATLLGAKVSQYLMLNTGLQTLQISTLGVTVTPQYSPPLVSDCKKSTATPTTTSQFGYEEGGAITKLITPPAAGATQVQCSTHSFPSTTGSVFTM
uniref:Uncharacterized protein n=1 Tax=Panagrolaimus sp. ES5 TaxID=591445 RepID=A0AC34G741_9BILA